jgi:flagellar basal-body rod protein FlgF
LAGILREAGETVVNRSRTIAMENGLLVALSSQGVLRRTLDVVANNLANIDTAGFKAERMMVIEDPVTSRRPTIDGTRRTTFVRDLASVRDPSDGRLDETGNPLDLALRGDGYFVLTTSEGERYTRNGHFRLDTAGNLVSEDGHAVQGQGGQALTLTADDATIGLSRDGTLSSERGLIGKLRVVRFADPTALEPTADGLAAATGQTAEELAAPEMVQGMIEKSNVEPILEIERMIRVQRAYDQAKMVIDREDDRIRKMITAFVD